MLEDLSAEAQARLTAYKHTVVGHPRLVVADREVTQAIIEKAGYAHVLLYGPTGVGKSTMVHRITERFNAQAPAGTRPVLYVEARTPDALNFSRIDYYRQVLTLLDEHVVVRHILVNINSGSAPKGRRGGNDWAELRDGMEQALRKLQVRAVVIDEAQHLMKTDKLLDQLDWLKSLTNMTQTLHVLVGTYELLDFRNLSGQSARRGKDIHFGRYQFDDEHDRRDFQGALLFLLEHVPVERSVEDLMHHWDFCYTRSIGCIGTLRDWLVDAVAAVLGGKGTALTWEVLQAHAPPLERSLRMGLEAKDGERTLAGNRQSGEQLQQLLGVPNQPVPLVTPVAPTAGPKPRRRRSGTGSRSPKRDPTGSESI